MLFVLDATHLAITIHGLYYYIIQQFGNVIGLQSIIWSFKVQITLNVCFNFLNGGDIDLNWAGNNYNHGPILIHAQSVETWRAQFRFHVRKFQSIIVLGGAVKTYQIHQWTDLQGMKWSVLSSFAMSTAIDIVLSTAMCYYLQKSRSSFSMTNNRIVSVMHYVLISGSLTRQAFQTLPFFQHNLNVTQRLLSISTCYFCHNGTQSHISRNIIPADQIYVAMLNARRSGKDNDSSSFSIAKLMNLRRRRTERPSATHVETVADQASRFDSVAMSSIGYKARLDDDLDANGGQDADGSNRIGGISIHRIEERKYDEGDKKWSPV
uniref:Uncharacterized protein n=1 Tax=Psilocybe cubensis TaxID=181762 RepID=A0A8H8CFH1_PSICU